MPKDLIPLLQDEMSLPERAMLANLVHHPGFQVLVKLLDSSLERATQNVLSVDPESEDYERILLARQRQARAMHDFVGSLRRTIIYHTELGAIQQSEMDQAVIEAERNQ